jgi:pimeloyl-ACP methyl ester carboxylesterase
MYQLRFLLFLPFFLSFQCFYSQDSIIKINVSGGQLEGSLLLPNTKTPIPIVLIIAGSGATDRNGNQYEMENNSLKLMAQNLQKNGIASLRFDKRGVGESKEALSSERGLTIETYVKDITDCIKLLSKNKAYNQIIIAGHSEGALLGLLASEKNKNVSAYISIAGAGRPADVIIKEQFNKVPDNVKNIIFPLLDKLKKGDSIPAVPPMLYMLFRPSIQAYMTSWFKYDPAIEIKKLNIPQLIVQGTKDIQVKQVDAEMLAAASPVAKLCLILNMNHVLKYCEFDEKEKQMEIYSNPNLELHPDLIKELVSFIQNLKK